MNKQSAFGLAVVLMVVGSGSLQGASGQGGEIRPGENLVVQGLPAIPASLADEVRRYTESRSASLADWHPTERAMLISTRFANTAQIHRVKQPGGARTQTHVLRRADRRGHVRAQDRAVFPVPQRRGRQRVRPDLPLRRGGRADHAAHRRRPLAERRHRVEHPRRPDRLRLDPPQRGRPRHLRHGPARPEDRPARPGGQRGRLVRPRLVARRPAVADRRVPLRQREPPVAAGPPERPEVPAHRARPGKRVLSQRPVQQGRGRPVPDHGQGQRVSATGLHGPRDEADRPCSWIRSHGTSRAWTCRPTVGESPSARTRRASRGCTCSMSPAASCNAIDAVPAGIGRRAQVASERAGPGLHHLARPDRRRMSIRSIPRRASCPAGRKASWAGWSRRNCQSRSS